MNEPGTPADHVTPYDRAALPEPALLALLAAPVPNPGLVDYFGPVLHGELAALARIVAQRGRELQAGRRVYLLPGIMGSQLGFARGADKPPDVLWLDPIDISFGRLTELRLTSGSRAAPLGAMSYSYLKLALSLRAEGFDAVLLDYDWRRDIGSLGARLAERIAKDGAREVALIGHSMGGLVARAALTHAAGDRVSQLIMLGTPNAGSLAAVQGFRGTYSVVRKIAMLDLVHSAEFLASHVFASFPGLHELLPSNGLAGDIDVVRPANWPRGPGPDTSMLGAATGLERRLASGDHRFSMIVGCNRSTATAIAREGDDFEYEYTLRGDGTVPMDLARLDGASNYYVDCGHSDLPLADPVISGCVEILKSGATQRFATSAPPLDGARMHVRDAELREQYQGKVDWPHMTPEARRHFLDTLNEAPRGREVPRGI